MSLDPFAASQTVVLASTLASQTTSVPSGGSGTLVIYNGGPNVLYVKWGGTVAVPTAGVWTLGVMALAPGSTQSIGNTPGGGLLSYIAEVAGGEVIMSIGEGA